MNAEQSVTNQISRIILFSFVKVELNLFDKFDFVLKVVEMQPLQTTHRCLIWFCICPSDTSTTKWQKLGHITFAVVNSALLFCDVAANVAFCWKFISTDLERCLSTLMSFSACISTAYSVIIAVTLMRRKIHIIFKDLTAIYQSGMGKALQFKNIRVASIN